MIVRFVRDSIHRSPKRKALIIAAVALGTSVATAMLGVMLSIGDKMNRELRQAGANIVVTASAAALRGGVGGITAGTSGTANEIQESLIPNIHKIFWALSITGVSPSLSAQDGARPVVGVRFADLQAMNPSWQVRGHWADGGDSCMAGEGIARRNGWSVGQTIPVFGESCRVAGVISSGDEADDRVLLPLARLQGLIHKPGVVNRVDVAALTKPEDDFARKDPKTMSPKEFERWNCTNYVSSIAHQIEEAMPGTQARPVRRVADSEGRVLDRISGLMGLITLAALLSAGLSVWSLTATTMMERRGEIAIMQAIGGTRWLIATLLGSEIALIGLVGGIAGALAGAAQPLRRALRLEPAAILREGV
jgi:putative ABC transport system permease protein